MTRPARPEGPVAVRAARRIAPPGRVTDTQADPMWRERAAHLAVALLVLSPIAFAPGALYRFTLPKLLVLALAVACAACAAPGGRTPRRIALLLAAAATVLVTTALLSPAPVAQLFGRWPRYEGLVALPLYAGAFWAGARLLGPGAPPRRVATLRRSVVVTATVLSIVSGAEAAGLHPLGGDVARPGALLGNATEQGVVGLMLTALLAAWAIERASAVTLVGLAAACAVVVTSGSRAALVGTGLALLAVAALTQRAGATAPGAVPVWRRRAFALPLATTATLVVGALALPATRARISGEDAWAARSATGRTDLWDATWHLISERPWGWGPSGFVDALPGVLDAGWWSTADPAAPVDSPHSVVLQATVAGGVPLLVLGILLVVAGAMCARRSLAAATGRRSLLVGATAACAGCGVALLVHFTTAGTVPLAVFLAGALVAAPAPDPASPSARRALSRWHSRAVLAAGIGGVVLLVPATAAEYALDDGYADAAAGRVAEADAEFGRAVDLRPWDPDVPLLAASAFVAGAGSGDHGSAEAALRWGERASEATPSSIEALKVQVIALLALDRPADAARAAARGLDASPGEPELSLYAGLATAAAGDLRSAEEPLLAATANPFTRERAWLVLAEVYEGLGRPDDAASARTSAQD